jgi:hypothetical protein
VQITITSHEIIFHANDAMAKTIQMAILALASQDLYIILDLRELHAKNALLDVFWEEIKSLLESHARVDDRRHGKQSHCIPIILLLLLLRM